MEHERISKNNKVGIITLYHGNYNFGGLLQAYALPKVLKEYFGIEAEQIDYIPTEPTRKIEKQKNDKKDLSWYLYQMVYRFGIFFFDKLYKKRL